MLPSSFGKYQVTGQLGHGGMATVYEAYEPLLNRRVAIKVIHPHLASEGNFAVRFQQEARLVASLRHPHIIQLYDFDVLNGQHYMVMEYLDGGTLKERISQLRGQGQLIPLGQLASLLDALADALDYAHTSGAVHRDIKPANILFTREREPVISDFGIAKILSETGQLSVTGALVGTPIYMSPEQASGKPVDGRSDIYALGVMVYEMAAGRPPFLGDSATAIIMAHIMEAPPPPRTYNPNLPEPIQRAILTALAKKPEDRYATAGDFARTFRAALLGDVTSPTPDLQLEAATEINDDPADIEQHPTEIHPGSKGDSSPEKEPVPEKKVRLRPLGPGLRAGRLLARLGAAALILFVALAGLNFLAARKSPPIAPASDAAFTIAIANFDGSAASTKIDFARRIFDQIESELADFEGEVSIVRVEEIYENAASARAALAEQGAIVLIWGWYDDAGVSPHVELAAPIRSPTNDNLFFTTALAADQELSSPEALALLSFSQTVRLPKTVSGLELFVGNGPEQMAYIAATALGLAYQARDVPETALALYDRALENAPPLPASGNNTLGLDLVHFYRGMALAQLGRIPEAVSSLEQAVAANPELFPAQYNLAIFYPQVCLPPRPLDKAVAAAQAAVRLAPEDASARSLLASLYAEARQYEQALAEINAALALTPDDPNIHQLLGDVHSAAGEAALAETAWTEAARLFATRPEGGADPAGGTDPFGEALSLGDAYLKLGQFDQALSAYETARELDPESLAPLRGIGNVHFQNGEYADAREMFELWVAGAPESSTAQLFLALAASRLGDETAARAAFAQSAALAPCDTAPLILAGGFETQNGDYAAAEIAFAQAAALEPEYADAQYLLGAILYLQGKLEDALPPLMQAVELDPDASQPRHALATVFYDLENYGDAAIHWEMLTLANPFEPFYFTSLGNAYEKLGQLDEAIFAYQQSLALAENANVRLYLGLIFHQRGELDAAIAEYEKALETNPEDALALSGLGDAYAAGMHLPEAAEAYRRALELEESAGLHAQLGAVLARMDDLAGALAEYESAAALEGNNPLILASLAILYSQGGRLDEAQAVYEILAQTPAAAQAYAGLGQVAYKSCDLTGMAAAFAQAAANAQGNPFYLALPPLADEIQGNATSAAEAFAALQAAGGSDVFTRLVVGEHLLRTDQLDLAAAEFEAALEAPIASPVLLALVHYDLGSVYFLQDRLTPAKNEFEAALAAYPFLVDAQIGLGDIALLEGDASAALAFYEQAQALLPEYGWQLSADNAVLGAPLLEARLGLAYAALDDVAASGEAFARAEALAQTLLDQTPDWPQARFVWGFIHAAQGAPAEAEFAAALACDQTLGIAIQRVTRFLEDVAVP